MTVFVCPDPSCVGRFQIVAVNECVWHLLTVLIQYRTLDVAVVFKDSGAIGSVEFVDGKQVHD